MRIGIICASDAELEPFLPGLPEAGERALLKFYSGKRGDAGIVAVYSGVCKVNAAIAAQVLIDDFSPDFVINAGVAGGICESLEVLDTVIAEKTLYRDVAEDILTEYHPWLSENAFSADERLLAAAKALSDEYNLRFGKIATGESFVSRGEHEAIRRWFSPLAVDMESCAVAQVCFANGVPFLAVRTITDTPEKSGAENFAKNCAAASRIAAKVTFGIIEKLTEVVS